MVDLEVAAAVVVGVLIRFVVPLGILFALGAWLEHTGRLPGSGGLHSIKGK